MRATLACMKELEYALVTQNTSYLKNASIQNANLKKKKAMYSNYLS